MNVVDLTRKLVAMDTINPPGFEGRCAEYLAGLLEPAGFKVVISSFGEGRANLVATKGGRQDVRPICFTGHLDTVPLGAEPWSFDPFSGEVSGGRLYGRGTTDMKGGVAAMVLSALEVARKLDGTAGLVLVLTGGEETGCEGAKALCGLPGAIGEAGAIVVGEPTSNRPLIGHKGALWLHGVCRGVTAHGSTPELGKNAIYAACRAVSRVETYDFLVEEMEYLGRPSINVGRISGGLNINSVPDIAEFDIDIRTVPGQKHESIREDLRNHLGEELDLSPVLDVDGVLTDPEDEWVSGVLDHLQEKHGIKRAIETARYFTDCAVLTPEYGNPPTLILGPGDAALAHVTDEYCEIEKLEQAMEIYTSLIERWCDQA